MMIFSLNCMTELQVVQSDPRPGFIDLGLGNPDTSLLPFERVGKAAEEFFAGGRQAFPAVRPGAG